MKLPAINLRRTYLIARRDYLGYVKTWGFWISFFMPFIFGAMGFFFAAADIDVSPVRYETVLDETGQYGEAIVNFHKTEKRNEVEEAMLKGISIALPKEQKEELNRIVDKEGTAAGLAYVDTIAPGAAKNLKNPEGKMIFVDLPETDIESLKSHIKNEKPISYKGEEAKLNGVIHIYEESNRVRIDYWSSNFNNPPAVNLVNDYFRLKASRDYLTSGGLSLDGYSSSRNEALRATSYDPTKRDTGVEGDQAVTDKDTFPYVIAGILSGVLWLTVFSGAYMLLTSMLEEKLNKLMEMMLASVRFSEIIFGKLLGVAALTITAMLPYILLGLTAIVGVLFFGFGGSEMSEAIKNTFTVKMISFFFIFLILGYVFYGAFFIALGALAESMQDAQTLTTPIMLILTACIFVVPLGIQSPDSPLLVFASWFPLSAPFAAIVRLPADPPLWELCLSALFLGIISIGVIMLAERIFRYGVLSGAGVKGVTDWFKRTVLRRKTS